MTSELKSLSSTLGWQGKGGRRGAGGGGGVRLRRGKQETDRGMEWDEVLKRQKLRNTGLRETEGRIKELTPEIGTEKINLKKDTLQGRENKRRDTSESD